MAVMLERLVGKLINCIKEQSSSNGSEITIITSIEKYFDDEHSPSEIDFAVSLLLKEEDSLLYFITRTCSSISYKTYVNGAAKGLELTLRLIENHVHRVEKYASNIKKVCMVVMQAKVIAASCRIKAYSVLIALFTAKATLKRSFFPYEEIKIFVDKLMQELCNASKHTPTVLQKIYELWGVLGEHYETAVSKKAGQIMNNMVKKLQTQTGSIGREEVSMAVLTGCITGLSGFLVNFNPDGVIEFQDICSFRHQRQHSSSIYQCISKLCVYDLEHSRKLAHRATLELLTRHMSLFWDFMFPEYKWWHTTLKVWIDKQGDDRKAGIMALARFQQEVAHQLSLEDNDKNKEAFQYFVIYYKQTLEYHRSSPHELTLAIQGFGYLSRACSKLMKSTDVEVMFSLVLQRVQLTFMRLESDNEKLENLADFLESLSNIIREIENINDGQLVSLEQLCILAIGCYPLVLPQHQPNIIRAVKTSIMNVALIKGNKLDTFLSTVVYQGVIRTCSHVGVGLEGVELQMDEENLTNLVTYKSYLKLWKSLLNLAADKKLAERAGASPELMTNVAAKLYDVIITTLLSLIDKLNVSTKPKSQDVKTLKTVSMSWNSDCGLEATSLGDMTVLLNIADLYSELLLPASSHLTSWISKLTYGIINKSISFPIIGSFYKLLAVVLKAADQLKYFQCVYGDDVGEIEWSSHYIVKFLEDVLVKQRQYKGDLQVSCLQAVMATPVIVLEPLLQLIAPALQVVFNVGRSYLELAHKGMEALERWQKELPSEKLNSILKDILPSFDPFLRSRGYCGDADNGDDIDVPKSQMRRQKRLTEESELSRLQKRMLEFLSHLNTPTCLALLDQEQTSAVAWSSVKFLQVAVPFPDIRLEIYLDDFLPRVIELALSSERATRSAAGELLHAIVMVFLAKGLEVERSSSESLIQVFKHLAPALLQLGSHPDLLTSQLFEPLIIQTTHWLSSKWMLKSSQTAVLLEAIWDGLTHPTDTGVRDFSAVCIREFVIWSIKQLTDLDLRQHPLNVKAVIKQINTYCLHPSPYKRFGAALAFNNLYNILREQESLIDIFWIELFYHFLRNLALSRTEDTKQIVLALGRLRRVLSERSELFNKENNKRRVPLELKGSLLKDLLNWLIQQCASTHETYRKTCMVSVQKLACCIPGCGMVGEFLAGSHMVCGDFGAGIGLKFLLPEPLSGPTASIASVMAWLKQLLSSLDCYDWMVGLGLVPNENLLFPGRSSFYAATQYLLSISLQSATSVLELLRGEDFQYNALSVQEETEFKVTKCKVIVQLFEFVSVEACIKVLPDDFWSSRWWKVVCCCILTPTKVNFGINNQDLTSKLPDIMYKLLTTLNTHLMSHHLQNFYEALDNSQVADFQTVCSNLKAVFSGEQNVTTDMKNQLEGLMLLHRCGVFSHLEKATCWKGETILEAVVNEISDSTETTVEPNPAALNYVRKLLSFAFLLHSNVTLTLECIMDTMPLKDCKTFCTVTKGEHFTRLFKNQLLDHLTHDPLLQCIDYLLNEVNLYKVELIGLLVKYCEYTPTTSNRHGMDLISKLSNRWHQLVRWAQDNISLQLKVLDIATCIAKCFRNPNGCFKTAEMKPLATWVLSQIAASETRLPLRVKTNFLKLLPCVAQQDVDMDVELIDALNMLRSTHFPLTFSEFITGSLEADAYQIAFRQLLSALVQSGNIDILKTIISETRTDENHPCKDDIVISLSSFIKKLSLQGQNNALEKVFEVFENTEHFSEGRLIVIHLFLIPLIKAGLPVAVNTFFSKHISWILNKVKEKLETSNVLQGKVQLESKVGAFSLTEVMYGTLDGKDISAIIEPIGVLEEKQFSKDLLMKAYDVRKTEPQFPDDTYKKLFRVYQCSAYKAVISIITSREWNTLNVYGVFIFGEKPSHKLWSHIVPTDIPFSFPIDFDELPKRKKQLVEIKKNKFGNQSSEKSSIEPSMSVLASQSLFTSTLNEDITKYDFTGYSVRTYDEAAKAMQESELRANNVVVELDVDILNQHECMPTLYGLINHMVQSGQFPPPNPDEDLKLPAWMEFLKKPLESDTQHNNVKVFILKLILNCENCFQPYAKFWVSPIIECIVKKVLGDSINYMVADLIEMLIKWQNVPDKTEYDKVLVTNLLEFLILKCATERTDIFKYKLRLISYVLVNWKPSLSDSNVYPLLLQYTATAKEPGEEQKILIGLTTAANLLLHDQWPFEKIKKSYYYLALRANLMHTSSAIYQLSADVSGRLLKKMYEDVSEDVSSEDILFCNAVYDILAKSTQLSTYYNLDRFIICLYNIQKHYPPIASRFVAVCKDLIHTLPSTSRVMLLEVLHSALDYNSEARSYEDLLQALLYNFLKIDDVKTQIISLKLVKKMLSMVKDEQFDILVAEVNKLSEHSKSGCRILAYDIAANFYVRRLAAGDQSSHNVSICKDILIKALVDTSPEVQKRMNTFWNTGERLSDKTCNRIVDVISTLYSPKEEHHFLTTAVYLLLENAVDNPHCYTKVFAYPLTNCAYEEYKVIANWRAQHSSLVPMFAQTMSSYIASIGTQNEHSFNIRATSTSFAFTPTVKSEDEVIETPTTLISQPSTSSSFVVSGSSSSQSGHGSARSNTGSDIGVFAEPKRTRWIRNKDKIIRTFADRNILQSVKRDKMRNERRKKRDAEVKIIRDYRIGDFPDVEIKYIDIVKPLQLLVKRDSVIARQVFVALYAGLKAQSIDLPGFPSAVHNILKTTTQYDPSTIATMLDVILIQPDEIIVNFDTITKVCKNSKLLSMGSMLMEQLLLSSNTEPPPVKKCKPDPSQERNNNLWIQLAEIYRCMGETDVVKGIFENKMTSSCGSQIEEALDYESSRDWKGALFCYQEAIGNAKESVMEDFLYEACFKCCEYMSDWKTLNKCVRDQVNNDLNEIWCDSWTLDHYLPWLFTSEINNALIGESDPTEDFLQTVHDWMSDPKKEEHIKTRLGESLCMVYLLRNDVERCKLYSNNNLMQFIDNWAQLDVLQSKLRAQKLLQLQSMMEIHHYMSLPSEQSYNSKCSSSVKELLHHWSKNSPSNLDPLNNWETRALYRHFFANKLQGRMDEDDKVIKDAQLNSQMSLLDCAIQQKNYYVARKYIGFTHTQVTGFEKEENFWLRNSEVKLLLAQMQLKSVSGFEMTIEAAQFLKNVLDRLDTLLPTLQIKLTKHVAVLCSYMESIILKDPTVLSQLKSGTVYNFKAFTGFENMSSPEVVTTYLHERALSSLQKAVEIAEETTTDGSSPSQLAEAYFQLATFSSLEGNLNETILIESLLKSMKFGSSEARQFFPNLLLLPSLSTSNAQLFIDESDNIPEWMFLEWVPQLLSSLDSTKGLVIGHLLERIARVYPSALQFPFLLSCEMYQNISNKPPQQVIDRLNSLLTRSPTMSALVDALICLHYRPVVILHYHLKRLKQDIENNVNESTTYEILKKESFLSAEDINNVKGTLFKLNTKYEERIEQVVGTIKTDKQKAITELNKILDEVMKEEVSNYNPDNLLKNFSPFLDSFSQDRHGDIEIPGQYTGQARPIPEQHVMIAGFKNQVQIMPSLRRPIRITIIGNDAKERHYLVKFGEDLRQDQRIQQLFGVMNQILATDPDTARRGLSVDTYSVVPLNSRSGLIAWVYDTVPLRNFIIKSEHQKYDQAKEEFRKWIFGSNSGNSSKIYAAVYKTYTRKETIENYTRIMNILPNDLLRKAVHRMAASSEAYMYLRSQMLTSHAVLCICHWLLGIGDRHLDNTLVSTKTGRFLGIDFGHAFGTAVGLPIPELMPFRMTPQIQNLGAPLYLKGTLQETMVHTLHTLRSSRRILINIMYVFIQEPSMNWLNNSHKYNQEHRMKDESEGDWYPRDRIDLAKRKLHGDHPSLIMETELKTSHKKNSCLQYFVQLVQGVKEDEGVLQGNIRATIPEHKLTPREQVLCLLDQATDQHILGKTYLGWEPYV